jgi:hypothetical protein
MGKTTKLESNTNGSKQAGEPTEASDTESVKADVAKDATEAKAKHTRVHRGQNCEVVRVTKNLLTGAIYDHILYERNVTNRRTGEVAPAFVGKKLRRPGTGVAVVDVTEVEVEE